MNFKQYFAALAFVGFSVTASAAAPAPMWYDQVHGVLNELNAKLDDSSADLQHWNDSVNALGGRFDEMQALRQSTFNLIRNKFNMIQSNLNQSEQDRIIAVNDLTNQLNILRTTTDEEIAQLQSLNADLQAQLLVAQNSLANVNQENEAQALGIINSLTALQAKYSALLAQRESFSNTLQAFINRVSAFADQDNGDLNQISNDLGLNPVVVIPVAGE
ncbi:hypothetical protein K2X40_01485 [Candidatus Babeliales bacterium]|nr:hypothetical protein [Candidatus Babeliales bacterium]